MATEELELKDIDQTLFSTVIGCDCSLKGVGAGVFMFKPSDYNLIDPEIVTTFEIGLGSGGRFIHINDFCLFLKKWAFRKGYLIQENGQKVNIYEREHSDGIFSLEDPKAEYISEEIFDVKNILIAGKFVLGCKKKEL